MGYVIGWLRIELCMLCKNRSYESFSLICFRNGGEFGERFGDVRRVDGCGVAGLRDDVVFPVPIPEICAQRSSDGVGEFHCLGGENGGKGQHGVEGGVRFWSGA